MNIHVFRNRIGFFILLAFLAFSVLLGGVACPPQNSSKQDPKEKLSNLNLGDDGSLLSFELAPGEFWKNGSREGEFKGFLADALEVASTSKKIATEKRNGRTGRVFHHKSHGCLTGKLKIFSQRSNDTNGATQVGLFQGERELDVIGRFSNGVGWDKHDADPDARGLALKIFVPQDESGDAKRFAGTVDFLMINSTNPLARDHAHFIEFMKANVGGDLATIKFASAQKKQDKNELPFFRHFARSVFGVIEGPHLERYWSGHPYLLGKHTHMKLNVYPTGWDNDSQLKYEARGDGITPHTVAKVLVETLEARALKSKNYLGASLRDAAAAGELQFILAIQIFKDHVSTPVENALVEWTERDSPSIPVGLITFDRQHFMHPDRERACEGLAFTPGHYHPDHRPTGNLGRGRIFSYLASQKMRGVLEKEPSSDLVHQWRNDRYY